LSTVLPLLTRFHDVLKEAQKPVRVHVAVEKSLLP